jgi:hypothetical protein
MDLRHCTWGRITTNELTTCFVIPPRCVLIDLRIANQAEV